MSLYLRLQNGFKWNKLKIDFYKQVTVPYFKRIFSCDNAMVQNQI